MIYLLIPALLWWVFGVGGLCIGVALAVLLLSWR